VTPSHLHKYVVILAPLIIRGILLALWIQHKDAAVAAAAAAVVVSINLV
jgi:hypothetical protein